MKQFKKLCFLLRLRACIGFPDLFVSQLNSLRYCRCSDFAITGFGFFRGCLLLALNDDFNRVNMLAVNAPQLKIRACASRPIRVGVINLVSSHRLIVKELAMYRPSLLTYSLLRLLMLSVVSHSSPCLRSL